MRKPSKIDLTLRQSVYLFCMQEVQRERQGIRADLGFLSQGEWLKDAAVSEYLLKRRGMWEIHLVFAWFSQPFHLIKRRITSLPSRGKAQLTASFMRRQAVNDARGTLRVDTSHFNISDN